MQSMVAELPWSEGTLVMISKTMGIDYANVMLKISISKLPAMHASLSVEKILCQTPKRKVKR